MRLTVNKLACNNFFMKSSGNISPLIDVTLLSIDQNVNRRITLSNSLEKMLKTQTYMLKSLDTRIFSSDGESDILHHRLKGKWKQKYVIISS